MKIYEKTYNKLSELNISDKDIKLIHAFYERPILKGNLLKSRLISSKEMREQIMENKLLTSYLYIFNPLEKFDLYTMETRQFRMLNDLGLTMQDDEFPYYIRLKHIRSKNIQFDYKENRRNVLLDDIESLDSLGDGYEFEYYIASLLKKVGYVNVEVTQGSGDQGIDVIAFDEKGAKYVVQAKYYTSNVGNSSVQEAHAGKSYYDAEISVVATNSYFTKSAKELALSTGTRLWDRDVIVKMIQETNRNTSFN